MRFDKILSCAALAAMCSGLVLMTATASEAQSLRDRVKNSVTVEKQRSGTSGSVTVTHDKSGKTISTDGSVNPLTGEYEAQTQTSGGHGMKSSGQIDPKNQSIEGSATTNSGKSVDFHGKTGEGLTIEDDTGRSHTFRRK